MQQLKKLINSRSANFILPLATTIILIVFWELLVRLLAIPKFVLPAPSAIVAAMQTWSGAVWQNASQTLITTLVGFGLAIATGIILGFTIGYSRLAYAVLYPILVGFNTIPKVALVPLLALWFGIGTVPAIITAFLLAFFPIAVNVAVGLDTVETEMQDVLRSLGASRWENFQKVGFPHTLPFLFASLKIAISQAFIGSVISETVASNRGIGYLILSASANFDVALAFLGLLVLAVMGIVLYSCFALMEVYLIPWNR